MIGEVALLQAHVVVQEVARGQPQEQHREPAADPTDEKAGDRARRDADQHPPDDRGDLVANGDPPRASALRWYHHSGKVGHPARS
ncbi:MAG: hypothetical protein ABIR67_13855 [Gaiellaceae bacterium]